MIPPICVNEKHAAAMFDMKPAAFRAVVAIGRLPGPEIFGKDERWVVDDLKKAAREAWVKEERPSW